MAGQTINISVLADTAKFKSGLNDASGVAGKFGKGLAGVGLAVGALVATGAVALGGFIATSVKAAAESEKVAAQTEAVLKSTGMAAGRTADQIGNLALSLSRMSGVDDEVIQSGANVLATFTKIQGVNFDAATQAALDMSVAMGTDMSSAAMLVGKALNDPVKGMSALSRAGVQLTDDQKNLVKQLVATGDVAGAQAILLGELNTQFGGSAEAFGDTMLGSIERMKNAFGNLQEIIGGALLPVITPVFASIADGLEGIADSPAFAAIVEKFGSMAAGIADGSVKVDFSGFFAGLPAAAIAGIQAASTWLATGGLSEMLNAAMTMRQGFVDALIQVVPQIATALVTAIPAIVGALTQAIPQLLAGAVTMFQSIIQALQIIVPELLTAVIGMLPLLVESVLGMVPDILNSAIELFTSLVNAIPEILPPLIAAIVDTLPKLIETILGMLPGILDAAINLFMALVESIPVILPQLITAILTLLPMIIRTVIGMIPRLLDAAFQLFTALITAIPKIIPDLIGSIIGLLPTIIGTILGMVPDLIGAGADLIAGLVKGLVRAGASVGKALLKIAQDAVGNFLSFLGIKSPSRLFMTFGKYTVQGLVKGLNGNAGLVDAAMTGLSTRVSNGFDATLNVPPGYSRYGSSSGGGTVVNVTFQSTMTPTAEDGRKVVEAITEHLRFGGTVNFA